MRLEMMPLIGISVPDLDTAVPKFSALFGLEFRVFTSGVDYALTSSSAPGSDTAHPLPSNVRIAVDRSDMFELLELPGAREGFRNLHLRVDDIDAAVEHFRAQGLTPAQDLQAGIAREVIFDASELHGIRVCLLQFEGESFAAALAASPPADATRS